MRSGVLPWEKPGRPGSGRASLESPCREVNMQAFWGRIDVKARGLGGGLQAVRGSVVCNASPTT